MLTQRMMVSFSYLSTKAFVLRYGVGGGGGAEFYVTDSLQIFIQLKIVCDL